MAEFCKKCFLELNPELTEKDLVMTSGAELCEGCGEIVDEVVWEVKDKSSKKLNRTEDNKWTVNFH